MADSEKTKINEQFGMLADESNENQYDKNN
jgi:hypothetical protein